MENILLQTDSYKTSHYNQYRQDTTKIHSYLEARNSFEGIDKVVFFGLQSMLKKYFTGVQITKEKIDNNEDCKKIIQFFEELLKNPTTPHTLTDTHQPTHNTIPKEIY
jgi:nicotinic acid phosphoribosyltransferase